MRTQSNERRVPLFGQRQQSDLPPHVHETLQGPVELQGHTARVNACAFSYDWIATASDDCTVRVWPIKRKTEGLPWEYTKILHHTSPVGSCAFSSNNRTLFTVTRDSSIVAWKVMSTLCFDHSWQMIYIIGFRCLQLTTKIDIKKSIRQ
jgi:WD40 repeat protein